MIIKIWSRLSIVKCFYVTYMPSKKFKEKLRRRGPNLKERSIFNGKS